MMALNLARLTMMRGFALRQMSATSLPMCSPSRSQSVQIMRCVAFLASVSRFFAIPCCAGSCAQTQVSSCRGASQMARRDAQDW